MRLKNLLAAASVMAICAAGAAKATTVTIKSDAVPWLQASNPTMVTGYYTTAAGGGGQTSGILAPVVVNIAAGSASVTFSGGAGLMGGGPNTSYTVNPNGVWNIGYSGQYGYLPILNGYGTGTGSTNSAPNGYVLPSTYMEASNGPVDFHYGELVGSFANSSGTLIGSSFAIGTATVTEAIPTGATEVLLGTNIGTIGYAYGMDNMPAGQSFTVNYAFTAGSGGGIGATPELSTSLMMTLGILGLGFAAWRRRDMAS